jgi:ribonuclease J
VATFASHIHRVQQVVEASRAVGRSVTFLGPSLAANVRAARRLGHLKVAPGDIVPAARAASLPGERLTVVAPGLQGEPGAALSRVAHGRDPSYRLQPGDEVFLSGRTIPGSERAVGHLVDLCRAQGAVVRAGEEDGIHVSGHPSAEDVSRMLELVRPRHLLPVHGEARHRGALAQVATDLGFPRNQIFRGGNGQALLLEDGEVRLAGQATGERMVVSSGRVAPESDSLVRDRRSLGSRGVATAFAVVSSSGGFRWGPNVVLKGVLPSAEAEEGTRQAEAALRRHLADLPGQVGDSAAVEAEMRIALRRHFRRIGLEQPLILARAPMIDSGDDGPLQ